MVRRITTWLLLGGWAALLWAAEPETSVIAITTFSQQPAWEAPWRLEPVRRASGTGFVIRGKRILTNAHVVSWARQILARRYQDPRPYLARLSFVGHDCDLALLEVEDQRFFEGLEPLELGELPKVRSTVLTYGYPAGGEQISYTRGVVSRIEVQNYAHIGNRSLLAVQTDAAINPGNSGGPVVQEDKVVGVAFQGIPGLENAGFFIPPPIIRHFLEDIADGGYQGFPQAGIGLAPLHHEAYRRYLKLPDDDAGVAVDFVYAGGSAEGVLREEDVLLRVGPYAVGSDGAILYEGNRVHLSVALSAVQHGQKLPLQVWRRGERLEFDLPVRVFTEDRAEGNQYDVAPRYVVYGGLVFAPLSRDYLRTLGQIPPDAGTANLVHELFYHRLESPRTARREPVVLAMVLSHAINANFQTRGRALVNRINDRRINRLEDVVAALDQSSRAFDLFEFLPGQHLEALERSQAAAAQAEILQTYGVPRDRRL